MADYQTIKFRFPLCHGGNQAKKKQCPLKACRSVMFWQMVVSAFFNVHNVMEPLSRILHATCGTMNKIQGKWYFVAILQSSLIIVSCKNRKTLTISKCWKHFLANDQTIDFQLNARGNLALSEIRTERLVKIPYRMSNKYFWWIFFTKISELNIYHLLGVVLGSNVVYTNCRAFC